jgi:hypothetical protein
MGKKTRALTPDEQTAQVNLKRIWDEKRKALGLTQEGIAPFLGFETQGAVGHAINGRAPITVMLAFKFAKLLQVHPADIHPGVNEIIGALGVESDPAMGQIMEMFALARPEARKAAVYMLYSDIISHDTQLPPEIASSKLLTTDKSKTQNDVKELKPS